MIQILVTYNCGTKENRDAFYSELAANKVSELSEAEEGCFCYQYYFPCEDDTKVFLVEQWETIEHQHAHMELPHFDLVGQLKEKYGAKVRARFLECKEI